MQGAVLLLVLAGLFPGVAFRGEAFFERDVAIVWVPQVEAFVRSIHAGSWPVWDPTVAFGQPLLANPNVQVFYPPTWLNLIVGPWRFYSFYVLLHLLLAGTGLARLGARMGLSPAASLFAACIFVASAPVLSFVNVWHHLAGAAWMPWIVMAADRVHTAGSTRRDVLRLGLLLAVQVVAGSPDLCTLTGLVLLADVLRRLEWRRPWTSANLTRLRLLAIAYAAALALSAAQWLPSLERILAGSRGSLSSEARSFWSLHPLALFQVLLPLSFEDLPRWAGPEAAARLFELWSPFMRSGYLGLAAAVVVMGSLVARARPHRRFFLALLLGSVAVALGKHLFAHRLLATLIPPFALLRYPGKALVITALAWSLLAGMGLDTWREGLSGGARGRGAVLLGALSVALAAAYIAWWRGFWPLAPPRVAGGVDWSAVFAANAAAIGRAAALAAVGALAWLWGRAPASQLVLASVVVTELVTSNQAVNETAAIAVLNRKPEILRYVDLHPPSRLYVWDYVLRVPGRSRPTPGMLGLFMDVPGSPANLARVLAMQAYLYPPAGGRWGLRGSYDRDLLGLYPPWLDQMNLVLRSVEDTPGYLRLLQIGGVDRVVAMHPDHPGLLPLASLPGVFRRPIHVLEVPGSSPRVYVPARVQVASGDDLYRTLLDARFEPGRDAVIAEPLAGPPKGEMRGSARIVEDRPDRVTIEASMETPGLVVLLEGDDRGWQATVDARAARVTRANGAFRAVEVGPGRHQVELSYRPASLKWGLGCSLLTALGLLLGWRLPS